MSLLKAGWLAQGVIVCSMRFPLSLSADYALLASEGTTCLRLVLSAEAVAAVALHKQCVSMVTAVHASIRSVKEKKNGENDSDLMTPWWCRQRGRAMKGETGTKASIKLRNHYRHPSQQKIYIYKHVE